MLHALLAILQEVEAVAPAPTEISADAGKILLVLSAALGMSLVVERVIEFGKNLLDLAPTKPLGTATFKEHELDEELEGVLQRLKSPSVLAAEARVLALERHIAAAPAVDTGQLQIELDAARNELTAAMNVARDNDVEFEEGAPLATILVQEATDPDLANTGRKVALQLVTFAVGIVAAHISNVQLFGALLGVIDQTIDPSLDYALTGLFIGGGSQPVHTLIRFITERKYTPPPSPVDEVAVVAPASPAVVSIAAPSVSDAFNAGSGVAVIAPPAAWADIPYTGGVDVKKLETTHRRSGPPNKIIYHHTAMHLNSKFEDVVRVIKSRESNGHKWLTGYNCVVTSDGAINAFCRWDRYGNHAAGHNDRSLGISLNGNFETREVNKWSNYNGAYGPSRPTDVQLHAAARVVGLWCVIYDIVPDFATTIIPHYKVTPKACPGSDFPYDEFAHLVHEYYGRWSDEPAGQRFVEAFKTKPFLF